MYPRLRSADVIGNDFDLTSNKFSYTSLKEVDAKVPEFLVICVGGLEKDAR
jgi:hypothetical protein